VGARRRKLSVGDHAPAFRLKTLDGKECAQNQLLASGPTLLAFYKVSCSTCQFTFPYLDRMAKQSTIPFFGVSQDDAESTKNFRDDYRIAFPTLLDSRKEQYPASNAFGITHVPVMYLIEQDGRISWCCEGFSKLELEKLGGRVGVKPFRETEAVPNFKAG
jgi:peroxiredoxin